MEMSRLTQDGTAEPVSRDQILRHARGQGNIHFPCSADHEQDWQPYPVDPYSAICDDHTNIHTYIMDMCGTGNTAVREAINNISFCPGYRTVCSTVVGYLSNIGTSPRIRNTHISYFIQCMLKLH